MTLPPPRGTEARCSTRDSTLFEAAEMRVILLRPSRELGVALARSLAETKCTGLVALVDGPCPALEALDIVEQLVLPEATDAIANLIQQSATGAEVLRCYAVGVCC